MFVFSLFTVVVLCSALGSGISLVYFEFFAFLVYISFGIYLSYREKRCIFKQLNEQDEDSDSRAEEGEPEERE
jgi:hypothetical protein